MPNGLQQVDFIGIVQLVKPIRIKTQIDFVYGPSIQNRSVKRLKDYEFEPFSLT